MDILLTGTFGKRRHRNGFDGWFTHPLANMLVQFEQEALVLIKFAALLDPPTSSNSLVPLSQWPAKDRYGTSGMGHLGGDE